MVTNREIGGRVPSAYLARLERTYQIAPDVLDHRLTTHVVDPALLRADDFDGFCRARKEQLLGPIESVTGKRIQREVTDDALIDEVSTEHEPPTEEELARLVEDDVEPQGPASADRAAQA